MSGFFAQGTAAPGTLGLSAYVSMLIIETGAIVAGANTLINGSYVTTYHALTGSSVSWSALTSGQQEAAIIRAMQRLDAYESRWQAWRSSSLQTLSWPRYGVVAYGYDVATNTIPTPLKDAQAELALREAVTIRATMPDETTTEGYVVEEEKKVASLLKRVRYESPGKGRGLTPYYPAVMALIRPYMMEVGVLIEN